MPRASAKGTVERCGHSHLGLCDKNARGGSTIPRRQLFFLPHLLPQHRILNSSSNSSLTRMSSQPYVKRKSHCIDQVTHKNPYSSAPKRARRQLSPGYLPASLAVTQAVTSIELSDSSSDGSLTTKNNGRHRRMSFMRYPQRLLTSPM